MPKTLTITVTVTPEQAAMVARILDDEIQDASERAVGNWERDPSPERIAQLDARMEALQPIADAFDPPACCGGPHSTTCPANPLNWA